MQTLESKKCTWCSKEFNRGYYISCDTKESMTQWSKRKFCSNDCSSAFRNKKLVKTCETCTSYFLVSSSPSDTKRNAGRFCSRGCRKGDKNPSWKGDNVGYNGLHTWVNKTLGKPDTCEECGKSGLSKKHINWANKSHEYKRDLTDWLRLCVPCHRVYDNKSNLQLCT